jgi:hypothetical protein
MHGHMNVILLLLCYTEIWIIIYITDKHNISPAPPPSIMFVLRRDFCKTENPCIPTKRWDAGAT